MKKLVIALATVAAFAGPALAADMAPRAYSKAPTPMVAVANWTGLWISGGEFAYPVEEITVAGNLKEIFFNISEIADDLEFRGSVASPTLRIDGLTVGGE